jgi:RHH-type transcriptional regulator, rel operon repressor / antitoxin RelB
MSTTMTQRLEDDVKARLDKPFLAAEDNSEYLENHGWQIREINAAVEEANHGDFASANEVAAIAEKWNLSASHAVVHGDAPF